MPSISTTHSTNSTGDMEERDYYTDLHIEPRASEPQVKATFQVLAKQYHPDKSGDVDASMFRHIREAYVTLSSATPRVEYDRNYYPDRVPDAANNAEHAAPVASESLRPPHSFQSKQKVKEPGWSYLSGKLYRGCENIQRAWDALHPELYQDQG
jgi:curved DNA-binding protein CbpA